MTTVGADLELQGAIDNALKANAEIKSLIGAAPRIYTAVPAKAPFPYVTLGQNQELDDSAGQLDASEHFPVLHIWSRSDSWTEAKRIAAVIKNTLHNASLALTENKCKLIQFHRSDPVPDPDGVTKHIALTFRALTDNNQ